MSDLPQLLFMWSVRQHTPVIKSLIIIMLLTAWLSVCTVLLYAVLIVCVPLPYGV